MIISDRIKVIPDRTEFLFWATVVGDNNIAEMTRVSGFIVDDNNEQVIFFLPNALWKTYEPFIETGSELSLLMASIKDFESYQIKGQYINHQPCTKENIDFFLENVKTIISALSEMGIDGAKIFSYLSDESSTAVTMSVNEIFEQTPLPGTGERVKD